LFISFSYGDQIEAGLSVAVQAYQEGTMGAEQRANYRTDTEINGLGGLILSTPFFLFQYLFEPMPWKMSSILDVVVLLENMLRFWLIWNALKYLVGIYRNKPMFVARNFFGNGRFIFFIFLSYLIMETIWSLGTTNWGTGIRHHLPSLGLLLVASFAYRNATSSKYNRSHKS
jgi:magnesium-transporting ATPase (P-type)